MSMKIPLEMYDSFRQEKTAEDKRRAEFAALFEKGAAGVKDGKLDMDYMRWFFANFETHLAMGVVPMFDYSIWKTIGKVLSFDMEYSYAYIDLPEDRAPEVERDLCGETNWLREESDQQALHELLKENLVALGAYARRIESSTYDGWRQLLIGRAFCRRFSTNFFESEEAFEKFYEKYMDLIRVLWADNEIMRHFSAEKTIAQTHPHTPVNGPKKRKVRGGACAMDSEKRDK